MVTVRRLNPDEAKAIPPPSFAKVVKMGPVVEITGYQKEPSPPPCRPLDDNHYVMLDKAGNVLVDENGVPDIREYVHAETKFDAKQSVSRTLAKIRALINTNVVNLENVRWVTLTYAENMTDEKRLYDDFRKFWQRFLYWNVKQGHEKPEYISVVEPQGRGAWHVHAFFIWPCAAPFVDNNRVLAPMWGHGFTKVKAIKGNVDNLGAYFSAYLADMPLSDVEKMSDAEKIKALARGCDVVDAISEEDGKRVKKRILKGARLALYPPEMNIYRTSRGVKRPEVEKGLTYAEAKRKVNAGTLTFSRAFAISVIDEETNTEKTSIIFKEYYNMNRRSCQASDSEIFEKSVLRRCSICGLVLPDTEFPFISPVECYCRECMLNWDKL